jgi:hypothetical protein
MNKEEEVFILLKENESLKERLKTNRQKIQELLNSDFEAEKEKVLSIFEIDAKEVGLIESKNKKVMPKGV